MMMQELHPGLPDPEATPDYYAGVTTKRLVAWVVDVLIASIITAVLVPFTAFTALFFLPLLYAVVSALYRWLTLTRGSATWGMRLMAIEFRTRFGDRFDAGHAGLHTAGYVISWVVFPLQLISIAVMLLSARGQGLTDHLLGTAPINRPADF